MNLIQEQRNYIMWCEEEIKRLKEEVAYYKVQFEALQMEQDFQKDFQELNEEAANMIVEEVAATSSPRNTNSYREVISSTDPIEPPSVDFAKPSDYQGVTPGIATLIKQNNTQIQLLVQISEALKEIQIEICKQKFPAIPSDLISKLQNLSLGPPKLKEKPGKLRVRIHILHRQREGAMALIVFRDNRWQGDQAILAIMEVDLTHGSQMIYVILETMMTIGDFYRNVQISILTRGYEAWQNSEANLLITRGMVGRLSNTPNVGFAYEANIPMQPAEVNSQTMVDGRISLSFSNYTAAQPSENPQYNSKDEEVFETLAVLIETKPGVLTYSDDEYENFKEKRKKEKRKKEKYKTGRWDTMGQPSGKFDYYVNYDIPQIPSDLQLPPPSWGDEEENAPDKPNEREGLDHEVALEERYSSSYEPHILIHRISSQAVIPERQTSGSAGLDIAASHAAVIEPYGRDLIHTWLQIEVPYGYYGQLASRSGLAWKSGIEVGAGKIAYPEVYEVPHLSYTERGEKGFGSTDIQPNKASTSTIQQNKASNSQKYFTTEDIFVLLMPGEKLAVFAQETSLQNSYEQDHAANTSLGASVPRSMEPTLNHEEDDDDSNLDYIQYLASLSTQKAPIWDDYSDSEWTNPFASRGGGEEEFLEIVPSNCKEFIELIAANCEMEYPCLRRLVEGASVPSPAREHCALSLSDCSALLTVRTPDHSISLPGRPQARSIAHPFGLFVRPYT
ncbi:hypothetical protein ZIOFF_040396 [Zingiber officinale]|uniref:dUTP diphosphatase n=1 Tax=Zingiber officinale TaxID=94328 RepID=A0A8J5GFE8_ZINOF|nr:hypothetical protein ZIOFF_040396 [Zingiber officinale]